MKLKLTQDEIKNFILKPTYIYYEKTENGYIVHVNFRGDIFNRTYHTPDFIYNGEINMLKKKLEERFKEINDFLDKWE